MIFQKMETGILINKELRMIFMIVIVISVFVEKVWALKSEAVNMKMPVMRLILSSNENGAII